MTNKKEFLVETDILLDHLINKNSSLNSDLEIAMKQGTCFTTVLNSSEMYFAVKSKEEREAVDKLMYTLNVLGLHARYSLNVDEFTGKVTSVRDALICVTAKINKLPILTNMTEKYKKSGIKVLQTKDLRG
jgi:predicted nucleic acid-binding protein